MKKHRQLLLGIVSLSLMLFSAAASSDEIDHLGRLIGVAGRANPRRYLRR